MGKTIHAVLAVATCLTASIITEYTPLIIITTGGALGALVYAIPAAWQSVAGGKMRGVDRIDWELMYYLSSVIVWSGKSPDFPLSSRSVDTCSQGAEDGRGTLTRVRLR